MMKAYQLLMAFVWVLLSFTGNISIAEADSPREEASRRATTHDPKIDPLFDQLKEMYLEVLTRGLNQGNGQQLTGKNIDQLSAFVTKHQEAFSSERGMFLLTTFFDSKEFQRPITKAIKKYSRGQLKKSRFKDYAEMLVHSGIAGVGLETLRYFDVGPFGDIMVGDGLYYALILGFWLQFYHRFKARQSMTDDMVKEMKKVTKADLDALSLSCQNTFSGGINLTL